VDVGLNKYIFDFFVLKDHVRRNAYLNLLWDVSSSLLKTVALPSLQTPKVTAIPWLSLLAQDCSRFSCFSFRF
jgi:hypothetical protein